MLSSLSAAVSAIPLDTVATIVGTVIVDVIKAFL